MGGQIMQLPISNKIKTSADIVFCMDGTGSMDPCFEGVREGLVGFVEGLQTAAEVDFRLRLIVYRDRHDPSCGTKWDIYNFTSSVSEFTRQLGNIEPQGGGDAPESTLDALYLAIHSDWRPHKTYKTIVLLTDADTHPTLAYETYKRPDNDVHRVIQDFQTLRHVLLFMVVPQYPLYEKIEQAMNHADRKIVANFVPVGDERYKGLAAVPWGTLMKVVGETISRTSVAVIEG
jgi:hypothetical protein